LLKHAYSTRLKSSKHAKMSACSIKLALFEVTCFIILSFLTSTRLRFKSNILFANLIQLSGSILVLF
jgi:hypothetical protein